MKNNISLAVPQPEDESERGSGNECGGQEPKGPGDRFECQKNYCGYHKQTGGMFGDYADAVASKRFYGIDVFFDHR
jgi:hypothetical protein